MSITTVNPFNGQSIAVYEEMSAANVAAIIERTHRAFLDWRTTPFEHRAGLMRKAADVLKARAAQYARLMAEEMGKPVAQGKAEAEKCAWVCDYYANNAERFLGDEMVATDATKSFVTCNPLGIVLAVMPWNFPFWQVFRFAAPALMAGNAALLKHSSNVMGCALAIEHLFREAGFPEDLFRTLVISSGGVNGVIEHPHVRAVTLTGSSPAGRAVASTAGAMLKKTVLELGGSDAYIVLEDADIEHAATVCARSRLINSGQSCIAAKRFVVVESVRAKFEEMFLRMMQAASVGDPMSPTTDVGPLARKDLRDELHQQVCKSIDLGARCLLGGTVPDRSGWFYPPTVLTDVRKGMPAYDEELFGPAAAIIAARDEADAISIANDSPFGLGAAVFTGDRVRGERIASTELEAGCCFVNDFVRSDPRLPFGGVKESGYGRELSYYGIREFVNIKSVCIA